MLNASELPTLTHSAIALLLTTANSTVKITLLTVAPLVLLTEWLGFNNIRVSICIN